MSGNLAEIDFGLTDDQKLRLGLLLAAYTLANPGVDPLEVGNIMATWVKTGKGSLKGLVNAEVQGRAMSLPSLINAAFNQAECQDDDEDDDGPPGLAN